MAKKLGERLVEAGLVTTESINKALEHQKITGHRLGDCLVEIGLLQEAALLRFLAAEFQTRFVSAEKLAKAKIPTEVLDKVPVRLAEAQNVLPLAIDPERKLLSLVAAEPQNKKLLDEIALVTGMSEVYAYVGLRSTIAAAIRKHYYGDPTAFASLEGGAQLRTDMSTIANAYENTSGTNPRSSLQLKLETDARLRLQRVSGPQGRPNTGRGEAQLGSRGTMSDGDYLETLNVLVTMLERDRKHHRGHSAQLSRQATVVARRLGLPLKDVAAVAIAGYLHDLGKPAERHFCLASNAVNPEWSADARRYCRVPTKLFELVNLPVQVNTMIAQLYEAYDGSGGPQGAKGDDITIGARILAAVDSYLELTKNPTNAHGKLFSKEAALEHLRENAGKLYDPVVADIVMQVQSGELLRQRLTSDGRQILIVEPDEGTRLDLLESAQRQGLVTHALSSLDGAYDALAYQDCDVLVVGLKFGLQEVLGLLQAVRATAENAGLPVVVLGDPDPGTRERLMMGGATAVVAPAEPDEAAKTVRALYDDRILHNGPARLVRGSLDEIPAPELLKLLGSGKKSGRLHLKYHAHEGFLHLEQGQLVYAAIGAQSGEDAMRTLLSLQQADFRYDPDSLLLDVPQMARSLEQLSQQLAARRPSISTPTV
ncbi:HD domain-containing phosphohydrolase [Archangium sp.]|jgi:HD-GYP domain-containing protein (c-di-GMP phosphodiesterase class II)|uniref:HD domain-containing phosphohydrolase n=1 Tax=Archangium sp. TaxID=1872627 RepID=UPI002ED82D79